MTSKSPQRNTFQREGYLRRCKEKGEDPNQDDLDMFEKILEQEDHKFDDPKARENNLEYDLLTTDWILEKVRSNEAYAQNLYAAMCNNEFQKREMWPILKEERWSCSWRYAGGFVANMRQEGDYIDYYCSGIRNVSEDEEVNKLWDGRNFVSEQTVTEEIEADLYRLGWLVVKYKEDE